jgi:hypothetical protein
MNAQHPAAVDDPSPPPPALITSSVRCSNAEREQTSQRVQEAVGDGRPSLDEVEERLHGIYAARYQHELDSLVAGLPAATSRTGWTVVGRTVAPQLRAHLVLPRGHARANDSSVLHRPVLILLAILVIVAMLMLAIHGTVFDGAEHDPGLD